MKNRFAAKILTYLVAGAAVVNLVCLFGFNYWLPGYSFPASTQVTAAATGGINISGNILTYTGTGDINLILMDGVTAVDDQNKDITSDVTSAIKAGASLSEKMIEYQVKSGDGQIYRADRTLRLENYRGPSIDISNNLPRIPSDNVENVIDYLKDQALLSAKDGYGNDISGAITGDYSADETNPGTYMLTVSVTNSFNDSATTKVTFTADLTEPMLVLTDESITLKVGDEFNSNNYLKSAVDIDGSTISQVTATGAVNTDSPGSYTVTYSATGDTSGIEVSKELIVNVTE